MKERNVGAVVVIDQGQHVIGILSDRDAALAVVLNGASPDSLMKDVMTCDVVTIWEDQGVFNATQYMQGHEIRRLPIINRDGELVGMVTLDDLTGLLAQELHNLSKAIAPVLSQKAY